MILNHKFRRSASRQAKSVLLVLSLVVLRLAATALSQDPTPFAVAPPAEDGVDPQTRPTATVLRETIQTAEKVIRPLYSLVGADTRKSPKKVVSRQSLRTDVYPKLGNGLQPAPNTASPAPPISAVARQAINIGFAHDPGPGNYDGVVGRPNDVWNFVDIGTTAVGYLRSADGLGTPLTLKVSRHDGEWGIKDVSGIFHGYIYHNCQCVDLSATISGLPPGRYMAYVYAHGDAPNQNADVELAVGPESHGRKATLNDGSWKFRSKKFEEGVQYVSFPFRAEAGQPVIITAHRAGSGYSMLNAIQITPVNAVK